MGNFSSPAFPCTRDCPTTAVSCPSRSFLPLGIAGYQMRTISGRGDSGKRGPYQKYISIRPTAVPASKAAESTSIDLSARCNGKGGHGSVQLYLVQYEKCFLRITYWNMNPTIAQGTKLTAVAGGIWPTPVKMRLRKRPTQRQTPTLLKRETTHGKLI